MNDYDVTVGALLHDIGKVVQRAVGKKEGNHSFQGYEFIKSIPKFQQDSEVLNCIRYHHRKEKEGVDLKDDAICHIVDFADNISAICDRRSKEFEEDDKQKGIADIYRPLSSIFNLVVVNQDKELERVQKDLYFSNVKYDGIKRLCIPKSNEEDFSKEYYSQILEILKRNLKEIQEDGYDLSNNLLELLESTTSYIPSSTLNKEIADITLYDHLKTTACFSQCIYQYLQEKDIKNYANLLKESKKYYSENMFLLASLDLSGIQSFIFKIQETSALKMLRSRSFYLELLMEVICAEITKECKVSQCNILYKGGGHAYLILPNTTKCRDIFTNSIKKINNWLIEKYNVDLYIVGDYVETNVNILTNNNALKDDNIKDCYTNMFKDLSKKMSFRKSHKYQKDEFALLNKKTEVQGERECKICGASTNLDKNLSICSQCKAFVDISKALTVNDTYFVIRDELFEEKRPYLELPSITGKTLYCFVLERKELESKLIQIKPIMYFVKNDMKLGSVGQVKKFYLGDYAIKDDQGNIKSLEALARNAEGIDRYAVGKLDVDNLGSIFVKGFESQYNTISRTSTLSRYLSTFFKFYINEILKDKNVIIVFSGGDDTFIVGAYDDVLESISSIYDNFQKFTGNKITLSAGFSIFSSKYPIKRASKYCEDLLLTSKKQQNKNSITLFTNDFCYSWKELDEIKTKKEGLQRFFDIINKKDIEKQVGPIKNKSQLGNTFLYNLRTLIYDSIFKGENNLHKIAYLFAKMKEKINKEDEDIYRKFMETIYNDIKMNNAKKLITEIDLYLYSNRKRGE